MIKTYLAQPHTHTHTLTYIYVYRINVAYRSWLFQNPPKNETKQKVFKFFILLIFVYH